MTFDELAEFKKDLKNLLKKFRTLNDDLDVLKKVLEIAPGDWNFYIFIQNYQP
jgi:hypothetical protein